VWLVKHALRSAIKRREKGALQALGYGDNADVKIENVYITPENAKTGGRVQVSFELVNQANKTVALMVDFAIHFIKANGKSNPKVFKFKAVELRANQSLKFSKKVSLKPMTTRTCSQGHTRLK
jgi:hypothetical protein